MNMNKMRVQGLMRFLPLALLLPAQAAAEPTTLPVDLSTGRPIVTAQLNCEPVKVIYDTGGPNGTNSGGVTAATAVRLKLAVTGKSKVNGPEGGTPAEVDVHQAQSLRFGSYQAENLSLARSQSIPGGDILVGNSVFGRSGKILELDLAAKQLRLVDAPTATVAQWYPLAPNGHLHTSIAIGGKTYRAAIDTGFPGQLMIPKSLMDEVPLASAPKVIGRARTVSTEFEVMGADITAHVSIGDVKLPVSSAAFGPLPRVVVGTAALKDLTVLIDWKNKRFAIIESKAAAAKRSDARARSSAGEQTVIALAPVSR